MLLESLDSRTMEGAVAVREQEVSLVLYDSLLVPLQHDHKLLFNRAKDFKKEDDHFSKLVIQHPEGIRHELVHLLCL